MNFDYRKKSNSKLLLLFTIAFCLVSTFTLAFFYDHDWASSNVSMSGKVMIEAVGQGTEYKSIEDTTETNLVVNLDDNYDVLIPGMPITLYANCKVKRSTTMPLLRADLNLRLHDKITGATIGTETSEEFAFMATLYYQLQEQVRDFGWYLHTDGYFYYIKDVEQTGTGGDTILAEIDATESDVIIEFINEPINFPETVTEYYSGYGVRFEIKFQAIQNFIPDAAGNKLDNTITNAYKIFGNFTSGGVNQYTDNAYFNMVKTGGEWVISAKVKNMPENVTLPSVTPDGEPIKCVGDFSGVKGIKNLVIPSSYVSMHSGAFGNSSVVTVDMSQSKIKTLPGYAFQSAPLKTILLPDGLEVMEIGSLSYTQLSELTIPETVTTINQALILAHLKSLYIPKSVTYIANAFIQSPQLTKIEVDEENQYYKDVDNSLVLTKDGKQVICAVTTMESWSGSNKTVTIPEGVETLKPSSLSYCQGTKIILPSTLQTIGDSVFSSAVKSIEIDNNNNYLSTDGNSLMNKAGTTFILMINKNLEGQSYTVPNSVVTINNDAFVNVVLDTLNLGANVHITNSLSFKTLSVRKLTVDTNNINHYVDQGVALLTKDGVSLYKYANLADEGDIYTLPSTVKYINQQAFYNAKNLTTVILPEGLLNIENDAFVGCSSLTTVNTKNYTTSTITYNSMPTSMKKSAWRVFSGTKIVTLQAYGTFTAQNFANCTALKNVTFHLSCTSFGKQQFSNCARLEWVEFKSSTVPNVSEDMFDGCTSTIYKIYVPDDAVEAYKAQKQLKNYADRILPVSQKPAS